MITFKNNNNNTFTATFSILEKSFSYDFYVDTDNVIRYINSKDNADTSNDLISYMDKLFASHTLSPFFKHLGNELVKFIRVETGNNEITKLA